MERMFQYYTVFLTACLIFNSVHLFETDFFFFEEPGGAKPLRLNYINEKQPMFTNLNKELKKHKRNEENGLG